MAAFNESNARTQAPQFLGYSRGGQDTNAFGKLFSGLGEAIGMAAETADMGIQENIKEDVYAAYDQTNQEFGVTDRQLFEQDAGKPQVPADIQQAGENLRRMNMAVQQGNLSDTHYWARMEAQVRQLRAKYPGYREQIDSMVAGVTGQTPANALRRQMMSDAEASRSSAQQEESQFRTYLQSNEEYGPPDMWEGYASGKYDKMKLRQHISNNKQRKQTIETGRLEAAAAKDARELQQTDVLDLANRDIASMVDTLFYNTSTAVAGGQAGLMELVNRSQDPSSPGGKAVTPEEELAINQTFANIAVNFESQLNAQMYKPFAEGGTDSYATILSSDQINQIKSKAMMQIETMRNALTNKDFGLLTQKQRELESRKLQATMDVISSRSGDTLLRVSAMEKITGPELAQWMVMNNPSASAAYKHAVDAMFSDSIVSGTSLIDQIESAKTGGATDHTLYRDLFKQFTDGIITDKNSMEGATRLAQATFNDPSLKLLTGLKTPQDRMAVFNMMTSNAMTAKMQELGKNNPQIWEQYQGWSLRAFTYLFKSTADTVQDSVVSNPNVEITFDPKTNQFKQEFTRGGGDLAQTVLGRPFGAFDEAMNALQTQESSNAIAQINDALRRITPILQAQGLDTGEELAAAFEGMGIDLQAQKQPDFWRGLGQAVMDAVTGQSPTDPVKSRIDGAFDQFKGGSQKNGASPLGRQSSVFDFREGMSDVLTDEIGEDQLAGYAGDDTIERERQALASRIGTLSNPHGLSNPSGSPVVSDRMVVSRDVAEKLNASPEAPERLAGLLGFIGNLEAPLGYNQVYGRNKMAPLDQMTINQVLSYQRDRVRRGSPSSAVGRYQFIRPTLRGLVRELGLSGDELFTPELQDSLAVHLLKRRGLDKYLDGQISLENFGNSLAREWASLPVLTGRKRGRSYYAGDGLNNALTDTTAAQQAIASVF